MKRSISFLLLAVLLLTVVSCSAKSEWQEQYDLGIRYLNEGNYFEAVVAFTTAIEIDEKNPAAYLGRAQAYLKTGVDEGLTYAVLDYEKALEIDENLAEAYSGLADIYLLTDDYEKALATLKRAEETMGDASYDFYENKSVTLYSAEEQIVINLKELDTYLDAGWYTEPVIRMYAADGRTCVIYQSEIDAYENAGWYTEPVITMYATDGRTCVIYQSEINAYENVGWYTEPVITMYAADGRTCVIAQSAIEAYENAGWYTEPVITMYAVDGRTCVIAQSAIEAYENVGWYTEPVITMYAADGRTCVIAQSAIEAYENVGWYTEPVITMYAADGRTRITLMSEVEAYKRLGWYTEPVQAKRKIQPVLYLEASASDSDFLSFANENYNTLAFIQGFISMGAYFNVNYDVQISDSSAPWGNWCLVDDERVSSMEELKAFWYSYFSQSSDKNNYTEMYKEIDGRLYSACPGVGGAPGGEPNFTKVHKISNSRVEIVGTEDNYWEMEYVSTRNIAIVMVLEDNIWMCEQVI